MFEHTWRGSCLCDDRGCLSMHGGVTCDDSGYLSMYRRVTCLTIMGGNKVFEHAQRRSHTLKKEGI